MQRDFFKPDEEIKWEILEIKYKYFWNEQNKMFDSMPIYIHTRPLDWTGPDKGTGVPWE